MNVQSSVVMLKEEFPDGTLVEVNLDVESLKFVGTVVGIVNSNAWPGHLLVKFERSDDEETIRAITSHGYRVLTIPYLRSIRASNFETNITKI